MSLLVKSDPLLKSCNLLCGDREELFNLIARFVKYVQMLSRDQLLSAYGIGSIFLNSLSKIRELSGENHERQRSDRICWNQIQSVPRRLKCRGALRRRCSEEGAGPARLKFFKRGDGAPNFDYVPPQRILKLHHKIEAFSVKFPRLHGAIKCNFAHRAFVGGQRRNTGNDGSYQALKLLYLSPDDGDRKATTQQDKYRGDESPNSWPNAHRKNVPPFGQYVQMETP